MSTDDVTQAVAEAEALAVATRAPALLAVLDRIAGELADPAR